MPVLSITSLGGLIRSLVPRPSASAIRTLRLAAMGLTLLALCPALSFAAESDIPLPDLHGIHFTILWIPFPGRLLLFLGLIVCLGGGLFGLLHALGPCSRSRP
jgi:hypothetical protein